MSKASKIDNKSIIHFELEKLENKVNEFQEYLEINSITKKAVDNKDDDNVQDDLHKEILIQIKMQDALFGWLPLLEKLRDGLSKKGVETRGDIEINGLFKSKS